MIAMALACNPDLLLPMSRRGSGRYHSAQILDLLRQQDKINSSIMLITHDLGVIAEMVDYVVVMYSGKVEQGTAVEIFAHPTSLYNRTYGIKTNCR